MHSVHPFHSFTVLLPCSDPIGDMDLTDHEDTILLPDLTTYTRSQLTLTCTDPARLQRASEGPRQSAAG